jgi:hypothetical protein
VRALSAEELQRFLDAHHGQPTRPLGSGWAALDPAGHPAGVPGAVPEAAPALPGPPRSAPAEAAEAAAGSPGRSALAQYRRRRSQELAAWTRSLVWRAPLVAAAGLTGSALATQVGLARTLPTLAGLAAAALVGWRLRFRPSTQARAWRRGAHGERQTARLLDRLGRDGYQVFHDLAMPGSSANIDHLVVGPSGVFVIDSKQWTGQVQQSADGLIWHNCHIHPPPERTGSVGSSAATRTARSARRRHVRPRPGRQGSAAASPAAGMPVAYWLAAAASPASSSPSWLACLEPVLADGLVRWRQGTAVALGSLIAGGRPGATRALAKSRWGSWESLWQAGSRRRPGPRKEATYSGRK